VSVDPPDYQVTWANGAPDAPTPKLNDALAKAQKAYTAVKQSQKNERFAKAGQPEKGRYSDLHDVLQATRPALTAQGLSVTQEMVDPGPTITDGWYWIILRATMRHTSGEMISSTERWPVKPGCGDQAMKATCTYMARTQYKIFVNIHDGDDDDGNHAQDQADKARAAPRRQHKPRNPEPPQVDQTHAQAAVDELGAMGRTAEEQSAADKIAKTITAKIGEAHQDLKDPVEWRRVKADRKLPDGALNSWPLDVLQGFNSWLDEKF
jgi:hypothetical protein